MAMEMSQSPQIGAFLQTEAEKWLGWPAIRSLNPLKSGHFFRPTISHD